MTCKAKSHNSLNKHTIANNQRGLAKQNHIIHNKQTNKPTNLQTNKHKGLAKQRAKSYNSQK